MHSFAGHPYNTGNFRGLAQECPLTDVSFDGSLPSELANGMYVRNGGNPSPQLREAEAFHWFDGFGALAGVHFRLKYGRIQPEFVARWVVTDLYAHQAESRSRKPVLPSIATLIASIAHLPFIIWAIVRSVILSVISLLGCTPIQRISVANTALAYHDGRALATCESGPPMWISLPDLGTVEWWGLEGDRPGEAGLSAQVGGGLLGMVNEWTTAHVSSCNGVLASGSLITVFELLQPKHDRQTGELLLYHASFVPPYLKYSVIPSSTAEGRRKSPGAKRILAEPLPIPQARMMHDFAASRHHTVILDCPLSLDPTQMLYGKATVNYSPNTPLRIGVFPRYLPDRIKWFSTGSCIIFHTANAWSDGHHVHLLCCRMSSASMIYVAGNLPPPKSTRPEKESCELYYIGLDTRLLDGSAPERSFSLSRIPFEFPRVSPKVAMDAARYVYGCSMRNGNFNVALGKASKIDCLAKVDVLALIARGHSKHLQHEEAADSRTVEQIIAEQQPRRSLDIDTEVIRVFPMPPHHYAQECTFVPRHEQRGEDDGLLLFYVFDERQLDENGDPRKNSKSELWVVDAWDMTTVVAKVHLPQRGAYFRLVMAEVLSHVLFDISQSHTVFTENGSQQRK